MKQRHGTADAPVCETAARTADLSGIEIVRRRLECPLRDYRVAMQQANRIADETLGENMLLSWYDRDRDFEAPQHPSECHQDSAAPGYVDYGIHHGARSMVDAEDGRFVFFYRSVEL